MTLPGPLGCCELLNSFVVGHLMRKKSCIFIHRFENNLYGCRNLYISKIYVLIFKLSTMFISPRAIITEISKQVEMITKEASQKNNSSNAMNL